MVERTKYYVPRAILRKRDQVYNQQVEGRSHFSEGGQNGQPSDRRDLTTVRDKTTTTTKTRHVRALQVATTPDQMQQNSLRASRNPDAPANGSLDQSPSNTNLLGDSDMSPPTDPEYSRLATWHDGSARHKYAQITPTEPIPPCAEYSRSDRTAESQDQRTGRDHGRDHGRDPSRILCLVSAHATEAADRVSTDDATPDPGSCRSLGQEDVLTRQDPTSDTQGDGDSSDLYDLGQANQPVVTSGGNQGGNQLETWCGSAESTYGGVERNLDLAVSHVSTDDATPDPSSCRSLGQEDVLTRQDPTSDTEDLLEGEDRQRLVICGGSNLVIRQVRGEIECKTVGLTLLRQKALDRLRVWTDHERMHVKRDWNSSAESLTSVALRRQGGVVVEDEGDLHDLVTVNRLGKILSTETGLRRPPPWLNEEDPDCGATLNDYQHDRVSRNQFDVGRSREDK
ncbi:hypothetical protein PR003_g29842 [Phytophthora rubi]|uniref:Uncharacterized protein n=1 Tax=Phytophthora rubi TaxID=129364 RepID=A0A6A4BJG1_9STRA|nr:hypothetical protein PR003_g29842 [Phytophthora rubi]